MKYVIVSGYVSILLGRARSSEVVDIIIPDINEDAFRRFLDRLKKENFYCLNTDSDDEVYENIKDGIPMRFAKEDTVIPNIELKKSEEYRRKAYA